MNFQHLNFGKFTNFIAQNIIHKKNSLIFIGRWTIPGISNSNHNVNKIFDRNNEDHCGSCISTVNSLKNDQEVISGIIDNTKRNVNVTISEDYYYPFVFN